MKINKVNPAYMTRQVHEFALKAHGILGHITSLNPIRPANAPDPWETRALRDFQTGLKEVSSVEEIEGNEYMRLMRPLLTEKGCLKCHALQGYKLGDIRGGISVSIPMAPHMAITQSHILGLCVGHGLLWLVGLVGIGFGFRRLNQQIHQRIGVEQALRESEERFRKLIEQSPVVYEMYDKNGMQRMVNTAYGKLWGIDPKSTVGSFNVWETDQVEALRSYLDQAYSGKSVVLPDIHWDSRKEVGEGRDRWISTIMYPLVDSHGEVESIVILHEDITVRKQAEEELRATEERLARSKKMEAMGLMAGGVAHDLNNILSGIVSYPELLLMNLPEDSPLRKPIKTIQESGMRAADVVEDLMTMARGVASSKNVLNLNTMVERYLESAEHQKLESIQPFVNFKTELAQGLLNISGSPIHIKKILMNLVNNASEAIEGSGTVTISTVNQYLDAPLKGYENIRTGEYVMLTVSDNGSGISLGDLERIFEPFYTKKVMGTSICFVCASMIDSFTGEDIAQEIRGNGLPAKGTVLKIWETGVRVNDNPVVGFLLEIHAEGMTPYEAETKALISILWIPQIQPGAVLPVKYDPEDPSRIALDIFEK